MRFLVPFLAALTLALSGTPALARDDTAAPLSLEQSQEQLAENMAVPFASGLVGAKDAPVFAWVENAAGVRNVWIGRPDAAARMRTQFTADDGIELYDLAVDPAGTRIAWVRGGDSGFSDGPLPNTTPLPEAPEQTLFLADIAGDGAAQAIGRGHSPLFSPDGSRIVFVRGSAIFVWSAAEGAREVADVDGSIGDLGWSPDGNRIAFRELRSGHSIVGVLDLAEGSLRYIGAALGYSSGPALSPDGREVAWIQFREPPPKFEDSTRSFWSVQVGDIASGAVRTVWTAPEGEGGQYYGTRARNLFWTGSGHLLFPYEGTGWLHILAVPAAGGPARDLTPNANEVENFIPTPDGRGVVYSANPGNLDSRTLWRADIASGATERLTGEDVFAFFPTFGGERLAASVTTASAPAHPVLVDGMQPLGPVARVAYPAPRSVTFTASDGETVYGQYFRGAGAGPHPALIFAHGGPRRQMLPGFMPLYYYHNTYIRNQEFAAAGYDVLSVNYRSGTNYGRAFREAPEKARAGASEYRDILAGARWLGEQPGVDDERIGIWGGSWGGYLAALALARDSAIFKAGVDLHGVHAMVRPVADTYSPEEIREIQQLQWDSSPMGSIEDWRSPVLIIHGDDDRNVDYRQSLLLARELEARGVPFEEIAFPNERHDFFRFENWLIAMRASGAFLDRHLKPGE
ncbi:prolyl oligopeptidase family serine peptidase [Qipengyuania sp. JC766]|uniref:prolyl oligopeptidase family serine peptidase n=1 Tax=Qipengyuania sp. JC766 TaxID=3232139 RepID=UPI0034584B5D